MGVPEKATCLRVQDRPSTRQINPNVGLSPRAPYPVATRGCAGGGHVTNRLRKVTRSHFFERERIVRLKLILLALLGLGSGLPALADEYSLTIDHCTAGCGAPPFGTIDVTQSGTDTVQVDVSLAAGDQFVRTGFPGSFAFDLTGNPAISVSGLTAGWSLLSTSAGSLHFDGFGYLEYALVCNACGNGGSHPFPGEISFDVTAPGLTPANFQELSNGGSAQVNFVADMLGTTGSTGPVGATLSSTSVPEPATLGLMSLGLAGATLLRRRRSCPRTVHCPRHHSQS